MSVVVSLVFGTVLTLTQDSAAVSGVVFDSIALRPLPHAVVTFVGAADSIVGRTYSATTDSAGLYRVRSLPRGRYVVGFSHSVLDSLGLEPDLQQVSVDGGELTLDLATPSSRVVALMLCGGSFDQATAGLIYGRLRGVAGEPIDGALVTLATADRPFTATRELKTKNGGAFAFCDVPLDSSLTIQASHLGSRSGRIPVRITAEIFRYEAMFVGDAEPLPPGTGSAHPGQGYRGSKSLRGLVVSELGQPITNATISLRDSEARTTTDASGRFSLRSLPGGTQILEIRRIGFSPSQAVVHLTTGSLPDLRVVLPTATNVLASVTVEASRSLAGFESRRRGSPVAAHFVTADKINQFAPTAPLTTLITGYSGVRRECRGSCSIVMERMSSTMTSTGRQACSPHIYVNGVRDRIAATDLDMLRAEDIAGIEIYTREAQLPAEFISLADRQPCGVIAVWTKTASKRR